MAVRTQCPRCKQALSVPNRMTGSYASCPRCQGRFWVSKDAPPDPAVNDAAGPLPASGLTSTEAPVAAPLGRPMPTSLPSGPPQVSAAAAGIPIPSQVPPRPYFPSVTPPAPTAFVPTQLPRADGPPAAPPQARKVARLVTADTAQSTLKLAADGQLPHLQLQDDDQKDKGQGKSRSISPLVMIFAWILSVVLTVAIVVISNNSGDSNATTEKKSQAMTAIEKDFFGDPVRSELLPYQRLLREARQANVRRDFKAERQYYKKVLDLLHTETLGGSAGEGSRDRLERGLTGSRGNDRKLEELILTVMGES